jgi:hypothetical protein
MRDISTASEAHIIDLDAGRVREHPTPGRHRAFFEWNARSGWIAHGNAYLMRKV